MKDHQLAVMARKDFDDAIRSKVLWILTAAFVLFMGTLIYIVTRGANIPAGLTAGEWRILVSRVLSSLVPWISHIVAILALIGGYTSIVDERRSGSIKLLLGQPFERAEILVGKMVGRSGVIAVSSLAGFAAIAAGIVLFLGVPPIVDLSWRLIGLFVLTAMLGGVYTVIAVSVSGLSSTRNRALMSIVSIFFVCQLAWTGVTSFVYSFFGSVSGNAPDLYLFLTYLTPGAAYTRLTALVTFSPPVPPAPHPSLMQDGVTGRALQAQQSGSFLLSEYTAFLILLAWVVLAGALAYSVFRDADLG
ncbi:ABC-2 type transport system permease protein [Halorientalis persicus]|jgi:ABC-2 type transport system permease protein|uniref:ABC-2 type transport system permease protein n=1 Tax=Halorientalis persicus TaxID=1367881 RepID=A0A1H8ESE0_9EURY|nr:ABC transporter permease subunit [Halorientalis persicus]SEN22501.1 ABC-2 type transport system permease protein [Halorientalis persicus]